MRVLIYTHVTSPIHSETTGSHSFLFQSRENYTCCLIRTVLFGLVNSMNIGLALGSGSSRGWSQEQSPNLFESIAGSINITQDRITRSRMAGDPPDILLAPKLSHIGLLGFYRASESIEEGAMCVERMLPEIHHVFEMA